MILKNKLFSERTFIYRTKDPLRFLKNKIFRNAAYHINSIKKEKKSIQTKHKENCYACKSLLIPEKILKQFEHDSNDQELNLTVEEDTILENQTNKGIILLLNKLIQEIHNKNKNINFAADQLIKNKFRVSLTLYDRKIDENLEISNLWKQLKEDIPKVFIIEKILAPTKKIEIRLIELEHEINKHKSKLTSYISLSNKLDTQKEEISPEVYAVSSDRMIEYQNLNQKSIDEIEKTKFLLINNPFTLL